MGRGVIRAFLLGAVTAAAISTVAFRPSPQDEARAAKAAQEIMHDSAKVSQHIKQGDYRQAELATLKAATDADLTGDKTLRNQLKEAADALELLGTTKLKLAQLIEQKTDFNTLSRIEEDTYIASTQRLKKYLEIAKEQGWERDLRAEIERGIGPVLIKATEIGESVAAHGNHKDVVLLFRTQAAQLLQH